MRAGVAEPGSRMRPITSCPYCLRGRLAADECVVCSRPVRTQGGVPVSTRQPEVHFSTPQPEVPVSTQRRGQRRRDKGCEDLAAIATTGTTAEGMQGLPGEPFDPSVSLEAVFDACSAGQLDARTVDRFFARRTVGWRVVFDGLPIGRTLVVGDHDPVCALALAEVADAVWYVGTAHAELEATRAIASAGGSTVHPLLSTPESLPFPTGSFDLVVTQCEASALSRFLSTLSPLLTATGRLVVLVDGWVRDVGLAGALGLAGPSRTTTHERVRAGVEAVPWRLERAIPRHGLGVERTLALLSRGRHENELAIDADSDAALEWLFDAFGPTADVSEHRHLRRLARLAHRSGFLRQCLPRLCYVCTRPPVENRSEDAAVVAGKNRTTVFSLEDGTLERVRKVPNSPRHAACTDAAMAASRQARMVDSVAPTIPDAQTVSTPFGPARCERPVTGTPLDVLIEPDLDRFERVLDVAFDWLERLQIGTRKEPIRLRPPDVTERLRDPGLDLTGPPTVDRPITVPQVLAHGDFFGSNVYVETASDRDVETGTDWHVSAVIDWEWAQTQANPVVDAGFFTLELAAAVACDFKRGIRRMFLEETPHSVRLYDRLGRYLDRIGVTPEAFIALLVTGYLDRARVDRRYNGRLDVDWPGRIRYLWARHEELLEAVDDRLVTAVSYSSR